MEWAAQCHLATRGTEARRLRVAGTTTPEQTPHAVQHVRPPIAARGYPARKNRTELAHSLIRLNSMRDRLVLTGTTLVATGHLHLFVTDQCSTSASWAT